MRRLLLLLILLLTSCTGAYNVSSKLEVTPEVLTQVNSLYSPWFERAFCVSTIQVYNILEGGWMSVEMPPCERLDIPFHTHPWWAEDFPNFIDLSAWEEHWRLYGNQSFGIIFGVDKLKIYKRK